MKVTVEFHHSTEFSRFVRSLQGPAMRQAGARGLNEHAEEQRRQSVTRIAATTGVPKGRIAGKTKVIKATPGLSMSASIRTEDVAIPLAEYGNPVWVRDLNPMADGRRGGAVSSMRGAKATGWNVRRQFPGAFIANGQVVVRTTKSRFPLKVLSMAVLANELADGFKRPNARAAYKFAEYDLEKRVLRHVMRALG